MSTNHPTDALGRPIVLGQTYGYSTNQSGICRTVSGVAIGITPSGRVNIEITSLKRFIYGEAIEESHEAEYRAKSAKVVHMSGHAMFPIARHDTRPLADSGFEGWWASDVELTNGEMVPRDSLYGAQTFKRLAADAYAAGMGDITKD